MTSNQTRESVLPESVIIFGCGYVGTALAETLIEQGVRVGALTRNAERAEELRKLGMSEVIVAELNGHEWIGKISGDYDAVVNCVSSAGGGLEGYRKSYLQGQQRILEWAKSQALKSFVYTSSSSVYAQDGGVFVDETVDTSEAPATGQVLLESERLIEEADDLFGAWYVLRLSGIYGPGRHFLLNQLREGKGTIPGPGDYHMNMVHRDDIISAILSALPGTSPSGIYNISDNKPATKETVLHYLAEQLQLPAPDFDPSQISPRLKRRGGRMPDRLISNEKAKKLLGWQPSYSSYKEGYAALLSDKR